jgi:hypothetical protein
MAAHGRHVWHGLAGTSMTIRRRTEMKKITLLLALSGLVLTTGSALAADVYNGVVARADPMTGEVTLLGGSTFQVSEPVLLHGLAPGEHVIVTVNENNTVGIQEDSSYSGAGDGGY